MGFAAGGALCRGRRAGAHPAADRGHDPATGRRRDGDPLCAGAVADAAELLRSLGHEVEEVDPPWRRGPLGAVGAVFSIHIALQIVYSGMVAGHKPTTEDMEPMSWAIHSMTQHFNSVQGLGLEIQLQALTRQLVAFLAPYDALLTPALAERPLPIGTLDTAAPDPMSTFTAPACSRPSPPCSTQRPARHLGAALPRGGSGLPLAVQLVGHPAGEATLLALATQLEAARPWAARRPSRPRRPRPNESTRRRAGRVTGRIPNS